jgi:hypothetical protein
VIFTTLIKLLHKAGIFKKKKKKKERKKIPQRHVKIVTGILKKSI